MEKQNQIIVEGVRAQNHSEVKSLQAKVNTLVNTLGYEAACKIKHDAFFTMFTATYGDAVLARSVERCLRRSVEKLWKAKKAQ